MKFRIKPYIFIENNNFSTFITEIYGFSIEELNQIISEIQNVLESKKNFGRFTGEVVSEVEYNKEKAKIFNYDELIGEEPTLDIYNMLKAYRDKLVEYENEQSSNPS